MEKYWVAHKKRLKLCNDVVLLNNRIQTKGNNSGFSNCLNGDLLPFVFDCLFQVL